jgi:hypothetical protein
MIYKFYRRSGILLALVLVFAGTLFAQELAIRLGNTNVGVNEAFTITITLSNEQMKTYSNFPDIAGFQKRGVSSQSSTNIVNGQVAFTQSIIQNYAPTKEGKFKLPAFAMEVNGKRAQCPGGVIVVGPAIQQQQQDAFGGDPFADFLGRGGQKEFVDVKDDAFFSLTTSKDKVYVGEGFTATLAFYVAEGNRAEMQFFDVGKQMQDIVKKLKPSNCWEENFGIEEIQPEQVVIGGKKYAEYKLYRASFYPINKQAVKFPALPMKMIKYKVAKNPSFFGQNKQQDFKEFTTKPKVVQVRELPPHPLRDNVSVGQFKLEESINSRKIVTGKSYNYTFKIVGEGNISSIRNPQLIDNKVFDIYPPNIYQDISRSGMAVTGAKNFNFFIVPKEPGAFKMGDYIYWIYFNTKTAKYDTLKSRSVLNVRGESSKNTSVSSNDLNDFMELISSYNNSIVNDTKHNIIKTAANVIMLLMLLITIVIIVKK